MYYQLNTYYVVKNRKANIGQVKPSATNRPGSMIAAGKTTENSLHLGFYCVNISEFVNMVNGKRYYLNGCYNFYDSFYIEISHLLACSLSTFHRWILNCANKRIFHVCAHICWRLAIFYFFTMSSKFNRVHCTQNNLLLTTI